VQVESTRGSGEIGEGGGTGRGGEESGYSIDYLISFMAFSF
jgi:hypothetical protein